MSIGSTRLSGQAGVAIDLKAFLAGDLSELQVPVAVPNTAWSYGTGAGAINVIYAKTITLAQPNGGGETVTLDLYASGTLLDVFNRALTMTALKFLYIKNNSADATLKVFGGTLADIPICAINTEIVKIKPGGDFTWRDPSAAGLLITTNKNLKLEHGGEGDSSMNVDVVAMGLD